MSLDMKLQKLMNRRHGLSVAEEKGKGKKLLIPIWYKQKLIHSELIVRRGCAFYHSFVLARKRER
jgi:hypothetical protein